MSLLKKAQHALEQRVRSSASGGEVIQQSRVWMRTTTWGLMGTAFCGIAWLGLATTEEIVVAPGKLEPLGGVREISIPLNGVVETLNVKEGEQVKKGQVLLTLDPEATAQNLKSLQDSIAINQKQLSLKEEELQRYLDLNTAEQRQLQNTLEVSEEILNRFTILEAEGATSELQLLQQKNGVEELRGQLAQLKLDRLRQTAVLNQSLEQIRKDQAMLKSDLTQQNVKARYEKVTSPVDGLVFELKPQGTGYVSRDGSAVMKVVPFDQLEARVEILSSDIGFVRVGQEADISIDSFPASDFGVLEGSIRTIGSDALAPEPQKPTYRYPADIELSEQKLTLKSGRQLPLQVGMSLTANIKLRKVSYLQLLLGGIRNKADSLRRI